MTATYRSPLLDRPQATELLDAPPLLDARGVAWHYGSPLVEQRIIETGTAIIDRSHRTVLKVSGADAGAFLNNLLSQKLDDAQSGFSASALDLDVQGHILHHVDITRTEDAFYLDMPSAQADSLENYLRKMVFWSDVEIERAQLGILTLLGASVAIPDVVFSREVTWNGPRRVDVAVPSTLIDATTRQLEDEGAQLAGLMAFTAERVKAGEPELGADLDSKSIPHEVASFIGNAEHLRAVHLHKGCYRGQETVSRVDNLGRSPRVLVMVHLDGSAPTTPSVGDSITSGGRSVGRLGTVVHDCDYGPIALALLKRSALDANQLVIGDVAISVDKASIPQDSGERPGRAAINRLRGL